MFMTFNHVEDDTVSQEKINLRKKVRQLVKKMPLSDRFNAGREIWVKLLSIPEFREARTVHTFLSSFPWEVSTFPLIQYLWSKNRRIIIPVVSQKDKELSHCILSQIENLRRGPLHVWYQQIPSMKEADLSEADIFIVPGMAFDRNRNRLGFGGGYYDRLFARIQKPKIAMAYSFQLFSGIPVTKMDQKIDIIITENEIIRK